MENLTREQEILNKIITEFEALASIPRKSGHEKKVSDYLLEKAKKLNLKVVQDEVNNIIIDKPATAGYEDIPVTILQCHMDMVCVSIEGKQYNPITDSIRVINDGKCLSAEGTSLGADDGIGVAVAMYILQDKDIAHGPLRVIITVDEENGMTGAKALDKKYLNAGYLINCDSEDVDIVTISSAGSINVDLKRTPSWHEPKNTAAYKFSVRGLLGGHSGMEINKGRANALRILALAIHTMEEAEINFELADFHGGTARNAIPADAYSTIIIKDLDIYKMNNVVAKMNAYINTTFGQVEKGYYLEFMPTSMPETVLSESDCRALIDFVCFVKNDVLAMSKEVNGLVETSSNLGVVRIKKEEMKLTVYPRSSVDEQLDDFQQELETLAKRYSFEIEFSGKAPGWPVNVQSKLAPLIKQIFEEQNKKPMQAESIHAGLECSWFYEKNPQLDIISIGPTVTGVHSYHERLHLDTVVPHVHLIIETLKQLRNFSN
ncbi:beta-Ala-His dipeptidase [Anaerosinus massiliensis]|uniref:beta-Ala-His dipeptidase n=1 Tax=Massilibacillus massiliensis TaxID=1806837 RepID=UPI000B2CA5D7|nr:beta-Ala-His dipeptidase [Massilibacillus massiliensis]